MYNLLKRIQEATQIDLKHKSIWELFASAVEELGEVSQELTIEEKTFGHNHKKIKEGSKVESVDLLICALAMFFAKGGTIEQLVEIGNLKMDKWKETQDECKTTS